MIKHFLISLIFFVTACSSNSIHTGLTTEEELLATELGYDLEVLQILKQATNNPIVQLTGYNEEQKTYKANGIASPTDKGAEILDLIRNELKGKDYFVFMESSQTVGIIKGKDQTKIIEIMGTEGPNYDIANEDVIDFFKDWRSKYDFNIVYADDSSVSVELNQLPKNLDLFANEIYDFCPDTVDSGSGSIEGLIEEIKLTNGVSFWWD
ncbi:hypothetical protein D3C75_369460 [compost metagenome]